MCLAITEVAKKKCYGKCGPWHNFIVAFGGIGLLIILLTTFAFSKLKQVAVLDLSHRQNSNCIYIPGGGHGAILFNYGQLAKLLEEVETTDNVYCSSAGCLSSVFALAGMENKDGVVEDIYAEAYQRAESIQSPPSFGQIVDGAINEMVSRLNDNQISRIGEKLNVLTTTIGIGLNARRPHNATHLQTLLRQTTWIPYLTADGWYHEDEDGIHLDGGFMTTLYDPDHCEHSMTTPFSFNWDLVRHAFIPVRSPAKIKDLIDSGYQYWSLNNKQKMN